MRTLGPDGVYVVAMGFSSMSLAERAQGAEWAIWPGVGPHVYEWNPAVAGWGAQAP